VISGRRLSGSARDCRFEFFPVIATQRYIGVIPEKDPVSAFHRPELPDPVQI
jgi:hypothetical protein